MLYSTCGGVRHVRQSVILKDERWNQITHRCTRRTVRRGFYCTTVIAYTQPSHIKI